MPKSVVPLTDKRIRSAKPKDKPYKLFDGGGLYVDIRKSGKKYFRYKSKDKTITLGEYPIITLSEAREWVRDKKRRVTVVGSRNLFKEVSEEFFEKKKDELSEKHLKTQKRRVEMYLSSVLEKKISEIEKSDVVAVLKNSPSNELKKRVFLLLKQIMKFAYARDYIEANICDKIDLKEFVIKQDVKHLKAITDEDEFKELVRGLWNIDNIHKSTLLSLRFLILTALRSGNVRGLRWEWVDMDSNVINFPAKVMKNKKEFRVPLTDTLRSLIEDAGVKSRGVIFHAYNEPNRQLSDMVYNMLIRRLGITNHTTHGFRSSFSTICYKYQHKHGFGSDIIETQLSHNIGNAVSRAYQRGDFLEERRELLKWWERFILPPATS